MKKRMAGFMIGAGIMLGSAVIAAAEDSKPDLIAVATIFDDAGWNTQKQYFDELIGPALNMEFVYSDKLTNANELTDFMTKSIAMGCTGIINFLTQNDIVAVGAELAEEQDVWYVTQNSMINEDVSELKHNLGHVGASVPGMEAAYRKLFAELIEEEKCKGFFIYTGSAPGGNEGAGASSHFYSVKGMLETIAEEYHLDYQSPIEELINNTTSSFVDTGRDDIKIYLSSSGSVIEGVKEAEELLGEGGFDTFVAVTSYTSFTTVVAEAEKKQDSDIMIIATVSDDDMTKAGFGTLDSNGHSVLHAAVINPLSIANAKCSYLLEKGLSGEGESVKENGHTVKYEVEPWICYDADEYAEIASMIQDQIKQLLEEQ